MQKISRRWWGAIALGAVPAFGVTACSTRKGSGMFDWIEGTKPLEERQTIEDYQAAVEVQLGRFVEQLGVQSGGAALLSPLLESVFAVTADTNCSPHRSPLISP